jgi:purine-binding chemotaxis protein CheW
LHKRFHIQSQEKSAEDLQFEGGFLILNIDGNKIGLVIDKIARVAEISSKDMNPPPQMLSGIGTEYIHGVVRQENGYLIILNTRKICNPKELQKIIGID